MTFVPESANRQDWPRLVAQAANKAQVRLKVLESRIVSTGGATSDTSAAVVDVAVPIGQPLAYVRATGHLTKAIASNKPLAFVVGLTQAATASSFIATAVNGPFTLADWTPIAGTVSLTPGLPYFLAVSGGITATPPASPNCLTLIGWAVGPQILRVEPEQPLQL